MSGKSDAVMARLLWLYGRSTWFIARWMGWSHYAVHQVVRPVRDLWGVAK